MAIGPRAHAFVSQPNFSLCRSLTSITPRVPEEVKQSTAFPVRPLSAEVDERRRLVCESEHLKLAKRAKLDSGSVEDPVSVRQGA